MENIKNKLELVGTLIESGNELEHDLALELLREIYSAIKFGMATAKADSATQSIDETALESEDCQVAEERAVIVEEPPMVTRRVTPDVIRSLYGSEQEFEQESDQEQDLEQEPVVTEAEPQSELSPECEEATGTADLSTRNEPAAEPRHETEPTQPTPTLGDVMATGHRTLGETLRNNERDMASKIAAADRPGLKRSIGLNDRFLMIRDMFDGDADAFDRTITRLDAFTDLDEAVIWIRDNFDWSADNRGTTLLIGLLERKLGH